MRWNSSTPAHRQAREPTIHGLRRSQPSGGLQGGVDLTDLRREALHATPPLAAGSPEPQLFAQQVGRGTAVARPELIDGSEDAVRGCIGHAVQCLATEHRSIEPFLEQAAVPLTAPMPADDGSSEPEAKAGRGALSIRRIVAAALLALAVAPGMWLRSEPHWPDNKGLRTLRFDSIVADTPGSWPACLRLVGAWRVTSDYHRFGGYSALLATAGGTLTAISDNGYTLRMRTPDLPGSAKPRFGRVRTPHPTYWEQDIEAATIDPRSGWRWYAYESTNQIRRFKSDDDSASSAVAPPAMRGWSPNGGAEAMARLPDGRFIVLAEDAPWLSAGGRPGLLFPSDPVAEAKPVEFTFRPPIGYDPSDMAVLPDGRVVILLRAIDPVSPPFFAAMLLVADPADIVAGQEWPWRKLADLEDPVPRDNYEGLAIVPDRSGVTMWLISDDNFARFQRTLLLKLHWDSTARRGGDVAVRPLRRPS
uniref:esterase-like activity of phytase family protein n=1 Tax=Altererythrobacter segetis TaxID=1104773 RepID=UPI00140A308D|nr:esterase-like activity of phytase family protein [Altererythrobacter segetis]